MSLSHFWTRKVFLSPQPKSHPSLCLAFYLNVCAVDNSLFHVAISSLAPEACSVTRLSPSHTLIKCSPQNSWLQTFSSFPCGPSLLLDTKRNINSCVCRWWHFRYFNQDDMFVFLGIWLYLWFHIILNQIITQQKCYIRYFSVFLKNYEVTVCKLVEEVNNLLNSCSR